MEWPLFKSVAAYLRIAEWIDSKVPLLLGVFVYFVFLEGASIASYPAELTAFFIYISCFLGSNYIVNDLSDIEADKIAGKQKIIAELPKSIVWLSIVLLLAIGNIPILLLAQSRAACLAVIAMTYVLGFSYSAPGIRFKERGAAGLVECALAQRCMPICVIPLMIEVQTWAFALVLFISFLDGTRYILLHQLQDRVNDLRSGIATYATSKAGNIRFLIKICIVLEIIGCCAASVPIAFASPAVVVIGVFLQLFVEYCSYKVLVSYAGKDYITIFDSVPLDFFYNLVFPLMSLFAMPISGTSIAIALFFILLSSRNILVKVGFARIVMTPKRGKSEVRHD